MYNRRYEKVFLMLRQEVAGYALGKRPPWGSCIMELKNGMGKLHVQIQGLRPLRQAPYGVYIMAGDETIFCGELRTDAKEGHGELKWEFSPDAAGDGRTAEEFHTVIVLAEDGERGISAPLTGFFGEKKEWKTNFIPRMRMVSQEPVKEEIQIQAAEAQPASVAEPKAEDTNSKIAEAQKQSYHGSFQGLLAKFRQELEELEETGILTPQETEKIRNIGSEEKKETPEEPERKPQIEAKESSVLPTGTEILLFAENRELEPFEDGEAWKCLSLEELTLLSQIPLKWQKEFFFLLPYRRYHHLILREAENGVWLGLPNRYTEADAADAKEFGFGEFRRVDGDWGYWMAFLERDS